MIFNIPVGFEFVSTDVPYQVAEYDENITYTDGDEVRIDDDIYQVFNYEENVPFPDFQDYRYYPTSGKVNLNGVGYRKSMSINDRGCWGTLKAATGAGEYDAINFEFWDGKTFGVGYNVGSDNSPCESDVTYTFIDNGDVDNYKNVRITKTLNSDGTVSEVGTIKLYNEITPDKDGGYVIIGGKVSKVFGVTADDVQDKLLKDGTWIKLENNYETVNKHKLEFLRKSVKKAPFDTKQFTKVSVDGAQKWIIKPNGSYNSIAIGGVSGNYLDIDFAENENPLESEVLQSNSISLKENRIASTQRRKDGTKIFLDYPEPTTHIIYSNENAPYIIITVTPIAQDYSVVGYVEKSSIGTIVPCLVIEAGATKQIFSHDIVNYGKSKVNEVSGYIEYIKGNRALKFKGSFYSNLTEYDMAILQDKRFNNDLIVIDGSDNLNNEEADSKNIFSSTKLIGRLKKIGRSTKETNGIMDTALAVPFEFEEIV